MKIPPLRTIHQYGAASPDCAALSPYRDYIQSCLDAAIKQRAFSSDQVKTFVDKGIPMNECRKLSLVLSWTLNLWLPRLTPPTQAPNNSHNRLVTKDVDINRDKVVTVDELACYAYRLDQAGNKDGKVSRAETSYGRMLSNQQYLMEEAKDVGLGSRKTRKLQKLLLSRRYTLSHHKLELCFDLPKQNRVRDVVEGKLQSIVDRYDDMVSQYHHLQFRFLRRLKRGVFSLFVNTGNYPADVTENATANSKTGHTMTPVQMEQCLIVKESPGRLGAVKREVARHRFNFRPPVPGKRQPSYWGLVKTDKLGEYQVKRNTDYRVKPWEVAESSDSAVGRSVWQALKGYKTRLADRLVQPDTRTMMDRLINDFDAALQNPSDMKAALMPLAQVIKDSLELKGVEFDVWDKIMENEQDPGNTSQLNGQFRVRDGGKTRLMLVSQGLYKSEYETMLADEREKREKWRQEDKSDQVLSDSALETRVKIKTFLSCLKTLVEEAMHAHQWLLKQGEIKSPYGMPDERIRDYADGYVVYVPPQSFLGALSGDYQLYVQHPLELDAKWVASEVKKSMERVFMPVESHAPTSGLEKPDAKPTG